ncbi:cis-golgi transport particle complex subunit [Trichoderma arundinaceum]|uniref:Cis-golgi transport particle complex subunit n=1 Tax=Trichoderma arundinaceum TaxID=490622 RepID=A0A395NYP4_TRIAR|nr:cis-golgi transport particle complex subunit [Trichoderma arundinaceum]
MIQYHIPDLEGADLSEGEDETPFRKSWRFETPSAKDPPQSTTRALQEYAQQPQRRPKDPLHRDPIYDARMSLDPLLPIAPARVKALLLPLGRIKASRFASFAERLQAEHVVQLRDISADGRPNRNMFSPLAYPDGAMLYDLIAHVPPPSHLALSPFDLFREPMAVIAIADGKELGDVTYSKRQSMNGKGPTPVEKNIRALYQELEELRDNYPKALIHRVLIFDYVTPTMEVPIPEGIAAIPPPEDSKRTTMKTVMCDISSLLLAEMTTLGKSYEAMTAIESPGGYSLARQLSTTSWGPDATSPTSFTRRNSQFALPQHLQRSNSATGVTDRSGARLSLPPVPTQRSPGSSVSTPGRPSTPLKSNLSSPPLSADDLSSASSHRPDSPESHPKPDFVEDASRDRVSVQGFGPGGANDRWRLKGKGRSAIVIGSMYLQAGRWGDSLKELSEGATAARSLNDHVWHGKALELILMNLLLLGWSGLTFQIPMVCLPTQDKHSSVKPEPENADETQPRHLRYLQTLLPELLERIVGLYSRLSAENVPPLPLAETVIRFSKILSAVHLNGGKLDQKAFDMIVLGKGLDKDLTTSPRLLITPTRQHILTLLFGAFPSTATELLTTVDRISILSGIAAVLGPLGYHRKKAMVTRELVSVLIGGLVEARTRGAADAGVHPAAGLVAVTAGNAQGTTGAMALDLAEGDIEQGIEAFLELLCKSYGVVGFDRAKPRRQSLSEGFDDSDDAVIARIRGQMKTRFFGFPDIKLNILRACINFSEALPDFNGVLKFSSDLMRTAGSGVAPGPRREDASPKIHRDEQVRLVSNISRTSNLVKRLGMSHLTAEFWDEFLVREIKLEPLPSTRIPIPHARSVLPGATTTRASQDVNPFIYNPFLQEPDETAAANLVAGEPAKFRVTIQNTYDVELDIESIRLETDGVDFEAMTESAIIGPYRTQAVRLQGQAKESGSIKVTGAIIKVRGCRERRFAVFPKHWKPYQEDKIKVKGIASVSAPMMSGKFHDMPLEPYNLDLNVTQPLPLVTAKSTTLPQSSVMILEGERQIFSVTLQNQSTTPVDFMLFSFKDSTQEPLQAALANRDATPAELYEYELILIKKQALRLPRTNQNRNIAPGGEETFEFEILGKPGLTHATIQIDYTYLGVPRDEVTEQFYTRQLSVPLTVTVNASVELARIDVMPMHGLIPQPLWERLGGTKPVKPDEYCLLSVDLRNAWPSQMAVHIENEDGMAVEEGILPGKTSRIIIPVKRVYLEDPHAAIPSLNPSKNRQFVVSTSKISPEMERANREAFWYREKILDCLKATWRTTAVPKRNGAVELRNIRLTSRMIDIVKVGEVGIDVSVERPEESESDTTTAYVDEFMQVRVRVTNRTSRPMSTLVRLLPALCHRSVNIALDYTRKFVWNGTLQQLLPELQGGSSTDFVIGVTALCRGEFELTASVEEVQIWEDADKRADGEQPQGRPRSDTQTMVDTALGMKERRMWHSRRPCILTVKDCD